MLESGPLFINKQILKTKGMEVHMKAQKTFSLNFFAYIYISKTYLIFLTVIIRVDI